MQTTEMFENNYKSSKFLFKSEEDWVTSSQWENMYVLQRMRMIGTTRWDDWIFWRTRTIPLSLSSINNPLKFKDSEEKMDS